MVLSVEKVRIIVIFIGLICFGWISVYAQDQAVPTQAENKLLQKIKKKEQMLNQKEALLKEKEAELQVLKTELGQMLKKLSAVKRELNNYFAQLQEMEEQRWVKLAGIYESAPPQEAGKQLENLDPKIAAQIMLRMNKKKAGAIWGYVNPEIASKITQEMAKLR
ncbi:MAG: hypothetical protein LWW94_01665 [Candidatus Desulfofervidaceae bacterium]|nr:hypothetical protein [Candidatus Desulfofervidaceae bacterium]